MKEKLEQIICRYGYNHQRKKLAEECAELILAIAKDTADMNFIEEMADVSVVIDQIVNHFPKFKAEFERIKEYKINRTISRINSDDNKDYGSKQLASLKQEIKKTKEFFEELYEGISANFY